MNELIIGAITTLSLSSIVYLYMKNKSKDEITKIKLECALIENELSQKIIDKEKELIIQKNDFVNSEMQIVKGFDVAKERSDNEKKELILKYENEIELIKQETENEKEKNRILYEQKIELIKKEAEKEKRSFEDKLNFIEDTKKDMSLQFKELSENVMEYQTKVNNSKIEDIVNPFKEQLKIFKEQVDTVYDRESKDRSMLKQELVDLKEMNSKITEETSKLTRALKGDNKALGNWGEMILESVLESSGLRKDIEYSREVSLKDKDGNMFRPDVVVRLPDERDIIIDSKTSLIGYEKYIRTGDKSALKEHLSSIKKHIAELSEKKYDKLEGINSLSFVFMFMPIESALSLALAEDKELFDKAYKSNIFLVSPSTLMMALKTVENTWKHKRQEENVKKIVNKAGTLYDKFVGFVTDIEKLGDQLKTVNKTYDNAVNKLNTGNGNIIKQVGELKEMGANTSKSL